MQKLKPQYLSKNGRAEFVVLTVEDYERMKQALEEADGLFPGALKNAPTPRAATVKQHFKRLNPKISWA